MQIHSGNPHAIYFFIDAVIASNERIPPIPGGECSLYESDEQAARAMVAMQMAQVGAAAAADINEAVDNSTEKED